MNNPSRDAQPPEAEVPETDMSEPEVIETDLSEDGVPESDVSETAGDEVASPEVSETGVPEAAASEKSETPPAPPGAIHWMVRIAERAGLEGKRPDVSSGSPATDAWAAVTKGYGISDQRLSELVAEYFRLDVAEMDKAEPNAVLLIPEMMARKHHVFPVIEDDPYGRLRFEGGHVKPLRALDEDVIYLGTFSKIFAPGLRLGWFIAPQPIKAKVLLTKQAADLCGSAFAQVTAERYFTGTKWRRVLRGLTERYAARRDAMLDALDEFFPSEATWTKPEGGFFVWVELPEFLDTSAMLAEAVESGVTFVPGDGFFPDGRGRNCMRLAFCYAEPEAIREGIARLGAVLEDRLELYRAFIAAGALPGQKSEEGAA